MLTLTVLGASLLGSARDAHAIPTLQLYIEGATYVGTGSASDPETWVAAPATTLRLWTIGNINGPGGTGGDPITNVRLSVVYDSSVGPLTIHLAPGLTGGFGGFTDSSLPSATVFTQISTAGDTPVIWDDTSSKDKDVTLAQHGMYGTGRTWQEFSLGDFTAGDSPIGDFINSLPAPIGTNNAQINVYTVTLSKLARVHFDLYGLTDDDNPDFAPFSHDAAGVGVGVEEQEEPVAPEPASLALLSLGGLGLLTRLRRRAKS